MILDVRTVFIMGAGFLAVTTITLGLLVPTLPRDTRRSAIVGTLATATLGVSWTLIALQGLVAERLSLLGGNLLYLIAAALLYQSIRLLDGEKARRGIYVYAVIPAIVATLLARYAVDSYTIRVVVMSAAVALLLGSAARRLFDDTDGVRWNPGRRPAAYWLAASSGVLVIRVIATLAGGGAPPLMTQSTFPNLYVAISVTVALGAVFAYFLVFSGRVTAELAMQAHLDPLTELLNRRGFVERAKQELRRSARTSTPVSLLMVDANDFKRINDNWGHQVGDQALRALANGIRARVRPYDLIGRLGGDEFAVLLPGLDQAAAAALVPRLLESIAGQPMERGVRLTVSIGKATLEPTRDEALRTGLRDMSEEEELLERLMSKADEDMYAVKSTRH